MQKVIDVRDMHTGIHSLYLVNRKPKTTCELFWNLSTFNDCPLNEFEGDFVWSDFVWIDIMENVESLGEIDFRNFIGDKVWHDGVLTSEVIYDDGDIKYKVIGSYDIY